VSGTASTIIIIGGDTSMLQRQRRARTTTITTTATAIATATPIAPAATIVPSPSDDEVASSTISQKEPSPLLL